MKTLIWTLALLLSPLAAIAADSPQVEVFVTEWCPYCRHLESFLKENDVRYTRYDVEKDERGARIFEELGGEGVPISRVNGEVVRGYDPDALAAALRRHG